MTRIAPEKIEEWIEMLNAPLPGRAKAKPSPAQVEDEAQGFMAALAAFGG